MFFSLRDCKSTKYLVFHLIRIHAYMVNLDLFGVNMTGPIYISTFKVSIFSKCPPRFWHASDANTLFFSLSFPFIKNRSPPHTVYRNSTT